MKCYQKLVYDKRDKIISTYWLISFLIIFLDTVTNYTNNPMWMIKANILLISLMVGFFVMIKRLDTYLYNIFLVYTYVFTLYIYLPVFVGSEELREVLFSSTSRIAGCMIYIPLLAFLGGVIHALVLGGLNVLLIMAALFQSCIFSGQHLSIDPVVVALFIGISVVSYYLVFYINKTIGEQQSTLANETQIEMSLMAERLDEEAKRNQFMAFKVDESNKLLENVSTKVTLLGQETNEYLKNQLLGQIKKMCQNQLETVAPNNVELYYKETDAGFVSWLKVKYPKLNQNQLLMCNLLLLGFQTKEVADKLHLSDNSAKKYRKIIIKNMGNIEDKNLRQHLKQLHHEYLLKRM